MISISDSYIISDDDYYYNFDDWINGKNNILIIVGLSGSGKSTLCKKISEQYNRPYFHTDEIFVKWHRQFKEKFKHRASNDDIEQYIVKNIITDIKQIINTATSPIILEGSWFMFFPISELKKHSVIIINTSLTKAIYRIYNRSKQEPSTKNRSFKENIEFFKWMILADYDYEKRLNKIRKSLGS